MASVNLGLNIGLSVLGLESCCCISIQILRWELSQIYCHIIHLCLIFCLNMVSVTFSETLYDLVLNHA